MYIVQYTVYHVYYTLYTMHCTNYIVQCIPVYVFVYSIIASIVDIHLVFEGRIWRSREGITCRYLTIYALVSILVFQ